MPEPRADAFARLFEAVHEGVYIGLLGPGKSTPLAANPHLNLNVIPIHLPPLRDRKEDVPLLMQHFLKNFSGLDSGAFSPKPDHAGSPEPGARSLTVSQEALRCLMSYSWPGNVRQLENGVERRAQPD